ncbi:MAG: 5-dehydro-2-deoxygluconokinase [Hyphomonas sp.]|nr:5-dehydro-2-deoxygluconokinase [Hyphomonas sp.]
MTSSTPDLDLITIGRSSIDLYGEQTGGRLEDMRSFAKYVGGSPTNTAVGAARLGLSAGLLTRVGADHFGRFIKEQLEREGVDTTGVITDQDRLTSLVFLGVKDPDTFPLIFYRENCADSAMNESDVDEDWIRSAASVLVNGTHLSQPHLFNASMKACQIAKAAGRKVIFDIDYRPVLWGLTSRDMGENRFVESRQVTSKLQEILPLCDLIVGTEEEFHILGGDTDTFDALQCVRAKSDALLVCKRGPDGCVVFPGPIPQNIDQGISGPGFEVEVFNVLGAGDSFMSGFLRGWLRDEPLEKCCEFANACGAIVVSRHGCAPAIPTWEELQSFLSARDRPFRLRDDEQLEHLHAATTRASQYDQLTVLAVDHRSQLEDMCEKLGADISRVPEFKSLVLKAVDRVAGGASSFGVLLDGRFGMRALEAAADHPYWIGRPIEFPGSRPLRFECSPDVGSELATWPSNHVVKCLVFYHPQDDEALRERQEQQLLTLQDACRKTGHEFLLEVILSKHGDVGEATVAEVLQRMYDIGLKPDWWKLEPDARAQSWRQVEAVIERNDPHCRGVVLLGLAAPEDEIVKSFEAVGEFDTVKGFAVGRTIFADVAEQWLDQKIDDEGAIERLASKFGALVDAWNQVKLGQKALEEVV